MQVARIRTLEEFTDYRNRNAARLQHIHDKEMKLAAANRQRVFHLRGFSYPANEMVNFLVDYNYSDGVHINWRERLVCPVTQLNNRLRASIQLIDFELGICPYHDIYLAEQVTPLYAYLKKKFTGLTGSEYLGPDQPPGAVNQQQIRHEDATGLSFSNESVDCYLSFECLEHIPDFKKAYAEAARILRPGGKFMWSVPFVNLQYENIIRAELSPGGEIHHLLEPEYHGDPVGEGGILCYTHFGWQMLDEIRAAGFKDVYAFLYWSDVFGYMGGEQVLFVAHK